MYPGGVCAPWDPQGLVCGANSVCVCVGVLTEAMLAALQRMPPAQADTADALLLPEVVEVASHGVALLRRCRDTHRIPCFFLI